MHDKGEMEREIIGKRPIGSMAARSAASHRLLGSRSGSCFPLTRLLILLAALPLLAGCFNTSVVSNPRNSPIISEEVDSVVVEPFGKGDDVLINDEDMKLFQKLMKAEMTFRPKLKLFEKPPTELPNTVILRGEIISYELQDRKEADFFLRAMHFKLRLIVASADRTRPSQEIIREYSFQKIYLPGQTIPVANFDLHTAAEEIAGLLSEVFYPVENPEGIYLDIADDPATGENLAHPLLLKGNRYATSYRFPRAIELWRLVLYNPKLPQGRLNFRLSNRSLYRLGEAGISKEVLKRLEVLTKLDAMDLLGFRAALREELEGVSAFEGKILQAANHSDDTMHLNLAAAHGNLSEFCLFEKKYDLAAYHIGRAYAHYPTEEYLERWAGIQRGRNIISEEIEDMEVIKLYLRLPPPRSLRATPGPVQESVLPPGLLEDTATADTEGAAPLSLGGTLPGAGGEAFEGLQPVELPPIEGTGEEGGGALPPIQQIEPATRPPAGAAPGQ